MSVPCHFGNARWLCLLPHKYANMQIPLFAICNCRTQIKVLFICFYAANNKTMNYEFMNRRMHKLPACLSLRGPHLRGWVIIFRVRDGGLNFPVFISKFSESDISFAIRARFD